MSGQPKRKPPVVAIKGTVRPDLVTQTDLTEIAELQASVWQVERAVHLAVERLRNRVFQGATVEDGELVFDWELKMVRRRKTG
jgi:hypothetical protein